MMINKQISTLWLILAVAVIALASIAGAVYILIDGEPANDVQVVAILAFGTGITAALTFIIKALVGLGEQLNGRLTDLVTEARKAAKAEGKAESQAEIVEANRTAAMAVGKAEAEAAHAAQASVPPPPPCP